MTDTVKLLQVVPIFSDLSVDSLRELADSCRQLTFKRNTVIMPEGESGECLYIIESGSVKIFVGDDDGREIILYEKGPGSYIGDIALLDDEPRSASVVTLEKTRVLSISKDDFLNCLEKNPALSLAIIRTLTKRLREATLGIRSLALDNVYRRLADKLMELAIEDQSGELALSKKYSQQELGNMIGASREMVGKVISELIKGEYIEFSDKRIRILRQLPRNW